MKDGLLINDLELGYAPMSAYAFRNLIKDKEFPKYVVDSHLYIIAQRNELTFNNFSSFQSNEIIRFEIKQENNTELIHCTLPIFQKYIATDRTKGVEVRLSNRNNTTKKKNSPPYNKTQGITFQEINLETNERKHLIWFSPEKLLKNHWDGHIELNTTGDIRKMLEYKVHYVGKSTEQNICARLSNHKTFQEILISQEPLTYGNIPSNEIVILLFRISDVNTITRWGKESTGEEVENFLNNYRTPDDRTISLDAEKALIKHLQPEYNKVLYKSYPKRDDLINMDVHDIILYGFVDPITLIYENGQIRGDENILDRDYLTIEQK